MNLLPRHYDFDQCHRWDNCNKNHNDYQHRCTDTDTDSQNIRPQDVIVTAPGHGVTCLLLLKVHIPRGIRMHTCTWGRCALDIAAANSQVNVFMCKCEEVYNFLNHVLSCTFENVVCARRGRMVEEP